MNEIEDLDIFDDVTWTDPTPMSESIKSYAFNSSVFSDRVPISTAITDQARYHLPCNILHSKELLS